MGCLEKAAALFSITYNRIRFCTCRAEISSEKLFSLQRMDYSSDQKLSPVDLREFGRQSTADSGETGNLRVRNAAMNSACIGQRLQMNGWLEEKLVPCVFLRCLFASQMYTFHFRFFGQFRSLNLSILGPGAPGQTESSLGNRHLWRSLPTD
jgi:hypothetical protein